MIKYSECQYAYERPPEEERFNAENVNLFWDNLTNNIM